MKRKRLAAAGLVAGLAAGGLGGFALGVPAVSFAQSATSSADSTTSSAAPDASAHENHLRDSLQSLIDDGTLNQSQVDAVVSALDAARPADDSGARRGHGRGPGLDAAASALGMSTDELHQAVDGGSTIADVAASKGVDVQTVIDAMVADLQAHLDDEVASGEHTQAEADQKLADATTRITDMVNGQMPDRPGPGD